ncbi:uncharacterized protein EV420DRAFT_487488 [Desarmillaria tabescens]|uniref:MYND-type domain-containing protein n=1 Tax=Armillaria tabescens TaxID=1929756 RepID=A0AA39J2A1_ARMTA|nr:uncharacterized protein EV420DRAFT_487488 [Desarmillaria tabescens]KAK0433932.1 hypothetical protein EV420DRAFT_487488 [Desarmillaria tabescens]
MSPTEILDLYDLALLFNYERGSSEPRYRHTKLREVVRDNESFQTVRLLNTAWSTRHSPKVAFAFDTIRPPKNKLNEPDLPTNILPTPIPPNLAHLSPKELETIYWQARNHDACYKSVTLIQHFFDYYPLETRVCIRTSAGTNYTTTISSRDIIEFKLHRPKLATNACVLPSGTGHFTGMEDVMDHAVLGFGDTILDLTSMQFGDEGRGLGGKSVFVLESQEKYYERLKKFAEYADTENAKHSFYIFPPEDPGVNEWLLDVARRVKERWDRRATEHWCGHCGAPAEMMRCSLCKDAYYCDKEHQAAAWPFHKKFCSGKK